MPVLQSPILDLLNLQWQIEMKNHFCYKQVETWASVSGLEGCRKYFHEQAKGELVHAKIIFKFISERGATVQVAPFVFSDPPKNTLADSLAYYLTLENATTESLQTIYMTALDVKDVQTFKWLKTLISIQTEEEAEAMLAVKTYQNLQGGSDETGVVNHLMDQWLAKNA